MGCDQVVTILQDMQKEIEAEGDKEQDLFDKCTSPVACIRNRKCNE